MTMATNTGLRRAYTLWATFYDSVVWFLRGSRRRSLALLELVREIPLGFGGLYFLYLLRRPRAARAP
ncbi:MAG: hypothetical protein HY766_05105 [candidate division NC10 bacterium]|nr:hypothetical protein [candidate division NC10 bacterium]